MKAYRIGRIAPPWINFEPPLRGGVYRRIGSEEAVEIHCEKPTWTPQAPSFNLRVDEPYDVPPFDTVPPLNTGTWTPQPPSLRSDISTVDSSSDDELEVSQELHVPCISDADVSDRDDDSVLCTRRKAFVSSSDDCKATSQTPFLPAPKALSRAAYTAALMREEIAKDILSNPSLDLETQAAITHEYQLLHERIKNEGYYECRYREYGKESIRYCLLFGTFFFLLKAKWFLTSACFLGMFWVRTNDLHASWTGLTSRSNKSCSLPMTPDIAAYQATSSSTP
jgi:delta8-fatty-acid desaturase